MTIQRGRRLQRLQLLFAAVVVIAGSCVHRGRSGSHVALGEEVTRSGQRVSRGALAGGQGRVRQRVMVRVS
mgnify:CR=1 FL=1